ncbi:hypothetical protein HMN09_01152200 [Mycena chlorophos]|uniref:F-box domain-containing protein n=1 Tax=Mycena chlorophos TaxID=658473 RepID=A0A8H6S7G1_MYCCL|nr:hypothetical protein HMN09_01152200 [Mycena chlorophos]
MWSWLVPSGLIAWMTFNIFHSIRRQLRARRRKVIRFEDLDDDILLYITAFTPFPHHQRITLSAVSPRLRRLFRPIIFRDVQWAPAFQAYAFPSDAIIPFIRSLTLLPYTHPMRRELRFDRPRIASQLQDELPKFSALRTFTLGHNLGGGMWTELLEALAFAPVLDKLVLFAPWGKSRPDSMQPLRLAENLRVPPLTLLLYESVTARPAGAGPSIVRRHASVMEVEGENLRRLVTACHATLETLGLPGEYLLQAINTGVNWRRLRTLYLRGLWPAEVCEQRPARQPSRNGMLDVTPPEGAQTRILRVLELMPNLRLLSLHMSVLRNDPDGVTYLVSTQTPSPPTRNGFLQHLEEFELASMTPEEQILEFLPLGLESLVLTRFPIEELGRTLRQPILSPSQLEQLLQRVQFPYLQKLTIWYRIRSPDDLDSEQRLLALLPQAFPLIKALTVHRLFNHVSAELKDLWNPIPSFRFLLSQHSHLTKFALNLDDPQRYNEYPFDSIRDGTYHQHISRLSQFARELVELCTSLRSIALYIEAGDDPTRYWQHWDVARARDGRIILTSYYV